MKMYFIAIVLPADLNEKILKWKNVMHEKFGCKVGLRSPAHITLIPPFWMHEQSGQTLIDDIDIISLPMKPFTIYAKNFSAFKPRTIYVDMLVDENLSALKSAVDNFFTNKNYNIKIDRRPFHPHITIATRDLHKKSFHEAWHLFATKKFSAEWQASGLSLLRHNLTNWDVVYTSTFNK
jgi:2'-5' RNA ligase